MKDMESAWNIGRMLSWMESYLEKRGDENPRVSARWLVSDVTGLSFMELYTNLERPLDAHELDVLRKNVRRRSSGEPLQYITGKTSFRHIDLAVRKGVLIPRPETEVLVSEVISELPPYRYNAADAEMAKPDRTIDIVDICTGSGCIACSLAFEHPLVKVFATDISKDCVSLARENVEALGLVDGVEVIECDLAEKLDIPKSGFHAIVSNPPYIPSDLLASLPKEVSEYEPDLALNGGEDGLSFFRRLADWAIGALSTDGFLAVELHETKLDDASDYAIEIGFSRSRSVKDLAGRPRVLIAYKE